MNYKLLRSDYYNEDYLLNKQEEKEFLLPIKSPYYKVRAKAFLLTGEVFGTWDTFQHLISTFIFTSETNEPQIKLRKINQNCINCIQKICSKKNLIHQIPI